MPVDLNALTLEHVMKLAKEPDDGWHPSTNNADADKILQKLHAAGVDSVVAGVRDDSGLTGLIECDIVTATEKFTGQGTSQGVAICRAALMFAGIDVPALEQAEAEALKKASEAQADPKPVADTTGTESPAVAESTAPAAEAAPAAEPAS